MHTIMSGREDLLYPGRFPEWVNLSTFFITSGADKKVEVHYHTYEEVWFWWKGKAASWTEGIEFGLLPGVLLYVPAHRQHAFTRVGEGMNTLLAPRLLDGQVWGHRHLNETGEALIPKRNAVLLVPEQTAIDSNYAFPIGTFLRRVVGGIAEDGTQLFTGSSPGWVALMPREGSLRGTADDQEIHVDTGDCLLLRQNTTADIRAGGTSDVAIVYGWPEAS